MTSELAACPGRDTALDTAFLRQQRAFAADGPPDLAIRLDRIDRLTTLTERHERDIALAIAADFGSRSHHETVLAEIVVTLAGLRHARRRLARWMRTRRTRTAVHFWPGYARIMRQPLGVVGVVSPWNYPYQLAMCPALAALAAGNRVMLKPSEATPRFSMLLAEMVATYFAPAEMTVMVGDADVGRAFVHLPFDHLLFTGSTAAGREVAAAAARNLTPVTLELGGKSPVLVDADVDLGMVAGRLAAGKLLNAGQSCIAPDYALVPEPDVTAFCEAMRGAVVARYPTLADNADYTSIVNERQYRRLCRLLEDARARGAHVIEINPAGEPLPASRRKCPPTLLAGVDDQMAIMQEEVFGPILPIVAYRHLDEAIAYVNRRPRPLALYYFGTNVAHRDRVLRETTSGGVTVNDTLWHYVQEDLPFGGVGASGYGAYHGERGFLTFSKEKPVFVQRKISALRMLCPPYGARMEWLLTVLKRMV